MPNHTTVGPPPAEPENRCPLLLMHGFGAFSWVLSKGGYERIARQLRTGGIEAYVPRVAPYETIEVRARAWLDHLHHLRRTTGKDRFHLIAFSMGGLDARYLISRLGGHAHVASLTTISTPHQGSSLADFVLNASPMMRRTVVGAMTTMGARQDTGLAPRVEATLENLCTAYIQDDFNARTPDHPEVQYRSYAGYAGRGTPNRISPLFWLHNRILYAREGLNDGFVSIDSARWGRFEGLIDADHGQLFGIPSGVSSFDAGAFYLDLARTCTRVPESHPA